MNQVNKNAIPFKTVIPAKAGTQINNGNGETKTQRVETMLERKRNTANGS